MTASFSDLLDRATEALSNLDAILASYMPRLRREARAKIIAAHVAANKGQVIGVTKMGPSGPIEICFAVEGTQKYEELHAVVKRWPESRF